jgi:hypothetical protein
MKTKTIVTATLVLLGTSAWCRAQHVWEDPNAWANGLVSYDHNVPKYNAQELSLDLFGSYINPEGKFTDLFKTSLQHGVWGGGAGLNYFFTENLGIGADFAISDFPKSDWEFNHVIGDVYLRLPIGNTGLAPYAFGGGGRGMHPAWQWLYGGGVGLEYRFGPHMGIFTDARFLWSHTATSLNELGFRAGVRLVF